MACGLRARTVPAFLAFLAGTMLLGCSSPNRSLSNPNSAPAATSTAPRAGPPAPTLAGLKPQLAGIIDQSQPPVSQYSSVVRGWVVEVPWAAVQASNSNNLTTDIIDKAIATASAMNLHLFLDLLSGQYAPEWVKNLPVTTGQQGPYTICNTAGATSKCGSLPHFWESDYQKAYARYVGMLASRYDSVPQIEAVGIDGCMTIFNEPLIRESSPPSNLTNYQTAGITESGDDACEHSQIQAFTAWQHTESFLSFNPYQQWTGNSFTTNEDYTESLISDCRTVLGQRCVLGNESVGKTFTVYGCGEIGTGNWESRNTYGRMYTKITCEGAPIGFRSATPAKVENAGNSVSSEIEWSAAHGAAMFQPPAGYDESGRSDFIAIPQASSFDNLLLANAVPKPTETGSSEPSITAGASPSTSWPPPPGVPPATAAHQGNKGERAAAGASRHSRSLNRRSSQLSTGNVADNGATNGVLIILGIVLAAVVILVILAIGSRRSQTARK